MTTLHLADIVKHALADAAKMLIEQNQTIRLDISENRGGVTVSIQLRGKRQCRPRRCPNYESIAHWASEHIELDLSYATKAFDAYEAYLAWCADKGVCPPPPRSLFGQALHEWYAQHAGLHLQKSRLRFEGRRTPTYMGIQIKRRELTSEEGTS